MCCLEEEETNTDHQFHWRNNKIYLCPKCKLQKYKNKEKNMYSLIARYDVSLSNAIYSADLLCGLGMFNNKVKGLPWWSIG